MFVKHATISSLEVPRGSDRPIVRHPCTRAQSRSWYPKSFSTRVVLFFTSIGQMCHPRYPTSLICLISRPSSTTFLAVSVSDNLVVLAAGALEERWYRIGG